MCYSGNYLEIQLSYVLAIGHPVIGPQFGLHPDPYISISMRDIIIYVARRWKKDLSLNTFVHYMTHFILKVGQGVKKGTKVRSS